MEKKYTFRDLNLEKDRFRDLNVEIMTHLKVVGRKLMCCRPCHSDQKNMHHNQGGYFFTGKKAKKGQQFVLVINLNVSLFPDRDPYKCHYFQIKILKCVIFQD